MSSTKMISGGVFPAWTAPLVGGGEARIGRAKTADWWQMVLVYRGLHCPVCRGYLKRVEELKDAFAQARAEVIAVSADPREKAERMVADQGLTFPVAYDLSVDRMREWGLYISKPRSADETDRPFAEPGLFGINENGVVHLIDISNTPFNRADLAETVDTVEWVRENDYPIRGTL